MIKRILLLVFISLISIMTIGIVVANTYSEKDNIKDSFYKSVNYSTFKDLLNFTILEKVPGDYRFYLHISGRVYMGKKGNTMSFHAFDEESQNSSWENGKTYTYTLKSKSVVECLLVFGLIDKNNQEFLYAIHISPNGTKSIEETNQKRVSIIVGENTLTVEEIVKKYLPHPFSPIVHVDSLEFKGKWKGNVIPGLTQEMEKLGWKMYDAMGSKQFYKKEINGQEIRISILPTEKGGPEEKNATTVAVVKVEK